MASNELLGHYLNDHLAGSVTGLNLAEKIEADNAGTPLGQSMGELVADIGADKATLEDLMAQLGVEKSRVKQTGGWVAEKLSGLKFSDKVTGSDALSRLMQMEMLSIGIEGKLALWRSLQAVAGSARRPGELGAATGQGSSVDLDQLIHRAQDQLDKLESHRLEAAVAAFGG